MANSTLEDNSLEAWSDTMDAATKAVLSIAQAILTNMLYGGHLLRSNRDVEPESFNGSRDKAKQFV